MIQRNHHETEVSEFSHKSEKPVKTHESTYDELSMEEKLILSESASGDEKTNHKGSMGAHEVRLRVNEGRESSMASKFVRRSDTVDHKWNRMRKMNTFGGAEDTPKSL